MSKTVEEQIEEVKGLVVAIQTEHEEKSKALGDEGAAQDVTIKAMEEKVGELVELKNRVFRVRRGGSWKSDPFSTSSYHRNYSMPHYASDFFGFRCVKDVKG